MSAKPSVITTLLGILKYPLQGTVVAAAVLFGLLSALSLRAGLFGIFLGFVVLVAAINYTIALVQSSAMGRPRAPELGPTSFNIASTPMPFYFAVILVAIGVVGLFVQRTLGDEGALVFQTLLLLLIPSILVLLALNGDVVQALNPIAQFRLVEDLGWRYLLLPAIYVLTLLAVQLLSLLEVSFPLMLVIGSYLHFQAMHAIGRLMYEFRDRVGLEAVNSATLIETLDQRQAKKEMVAMLGEAYQTGRTDPKAAATVLLTNLQNGQNNLPQRSAMFADLLTWDNKLTALFFAQDLIERQVQAADLAAALDVAVRCLAHNSNFRPKGAISTLKIAQLAMHNRQFSVLTALLCDFAQRHPQHPNAPASIVLCAEVALDKTNQPELAMALVRKAHADGHLAKSPRFLVLKERIAAL